VRAEVFAVEDTSIQVCWDHVPPGTIVIRAGSVTITVDGHGGPGAAILDGLPPASRVEVTATLDGGRPVRAGRPTTLAPPPGRRLSRFATLNDLHIGARSIGPLRPIWNDDPHDPHPMRCARAAVAEAIAWGAEALVVKGDATQAGRPHEFEMVGELLAGSGLPVIMIEGNHETKPGAVDGRAILARYGLELSVARPACLDLPGLRIVGTPTAHWHTDTGWIDERAWRETVELVGDAPTGAGAMVALHHYPQRFRYPTIYPAGIRGPGAAQFLDDLAAAHPATIVVTGHTHRHRWHQHGGMVVAEVGSTKDFPGSWAGYTVHEGGIMQTTRRVMAPDAISWTEGTRQIIGGIWSRWAPGLRTHRCFVYEWPGG